MNKTKTDFSELDMYKSIFDKVDKGIAVYRIEDNGKKIIFVDFNKAAEKINQIKKKEVIGMELRDVFPGVTKFGIVEKIIQVWKTGRPQELTLKEYEDGRVKGWRNNYICKLKTGEVVAIHDDASEQKKKEEEVLEQKEKLEILTSTSSDWLWETDENDIYVSSAGNLKKILGYSHSEIIGKSIYDLMSDKEVKKIKKFFDNLKKQKGKIVDAENWNDAKDGSKVCLLTNGVPLLDKNGDLRGYIGVDKDITDQKNYEKQLKQSKKRYKDLFDLNSDGILLVSQDNKKVIKANIKAKQILGCDLSGKKCVEVKKKLGFKFSELKGGEQEFRIKINFKKKDIQVNKSEFISEGSKMGIVIIRDITEEKLNKKTIEKRNKELERLNNLMVGRELKMIELKKEIKKLKNKK